MSVAFCDPAGGSGTDSMTLAIAHAGRRDGKVVAVLDLIREVRPPFSPEAVVAEFADVLKRYGIDSVTGDAYAGEWPRERFRTHGVEYRVSARVKSDIYRACLPLINSGQAALIDQQRLLAQLRSLERRTGWGGKDKIDHPRGGHDDLANAACGALLLAYRSAAEPTELVIICDPYVSRDVADSERRAQEADEASRQASAEAIEDGIRREGWWRAPPGGMFGRGLGRWRS